MLLIFNLLNSASSISHLGYICILDVIDSQSHKIYVTDTKVSSFRSLFYFSYYFSLYCPSRSKREAWVFWVKILLCTNLLVKPKFLPINGLSMIGLVIFLLHLYVNLFFACLSFALSMVLQFYFLWTTACLILPSVFSSF